MDDLKIAMLWLQARWATAREATRKATGEARRDENGFTALEWLVVALGVIAIAGIAVAAVKSYVTGQTNRLGSP